MRQAPHTKEFVARGIPFAYSKLYKSFFCDTKTMLYVLQKHHPSTCAEMVRKYPELGKVLTELKNPRFKPAFDPTFIDRTWHETQPPAQAVVQTVDPAVRAEEEVKEKAAAARKPGMLSRMSKGIKKIIAKITPKKLRKRFNMEDEGSAEQAKVEPAAKEEKSEKPLQNQ